MKLLSLLNAFAPATQVVAPIPAVTANVNIPDPDAGPSAMFWVTYDFNEPGTTPHTGVAGGTYSNTIASKTEIPVYLDTTHPSINTLDTAEPGKWTWVSHDLFLLHTAGTGSFSDAEPAATEPFITTHLKGMEDKGYNVLSTYFANSTKTFSPDKGYYLSNSNGTVDNPNLKNFINNELRLIDQPNSANNSMIKIEIVDQFSATGVFYQFDTNFYYSPVTSLFYTSPDAAGTTILNLTTIATH